MPAQATAPTSNRFSLNHHARNRFGHGFLLEFVLRFAAGVSVSRGRTACGRVIAGRESGVSRIFTRMPASPVLPNLTAFYSCCLGPLVRQNVTRHGFTRHARLQHTLAAALPLGSTVPSLTCSRQSKRCRTSCTRRLDHGRKECSLQRGASELRRISVGLGHRSPNSNMQLPLPRSARPAGHVNRG